MLDFHHIDSYPITGDPLGLMLFSCSITENLYLETFTMGLESSDLEAVTIQTSESYSGSLVGMGFAWKHEVNIATLLATARTLLWDYEMGLTI